jgi:hypothetical protein
VPTTSSSETWRLILDEAAVRRQTMVKYAKMAASKRHRWHQIRKQPTMAGGLFRGFVPQTPDGFKCLVISPAVNCISSELLIYF